MGKSTLVMLFLLAFGPNRGEPVSHEKLPPPAVKAQAGQAAPERLAAPAGPARPMAPIPLQAEIGPERSLPAREEAHPEHGRKNG